MKSAKEWLDQIESIPQTKSFLRNQALLSDIRAIQNDALESAAQINIDKTGREWVRESLWDAISQQFAASIRSLKT